MYEFPKQVIWVLNHFEQQEKEIFLVGGCVRDMLLQRELSDYDMTTNATPQEMIAYFEPLDCDIIPTGIKHGTITLVKDKMPIEITTYRHDGDYKDHRAPQQVSFTSDLQADLARRDFTMNAIAYHPKIGLVDPFHGQVDIKEKRIRCVGDSMLRFQEDALRMLRALRFHFVLDFEIEEEILTSIHTLSPLLTHISKERIRNEFSKMLRSDHCDILLTLRSLDVLPYIIPELEIIYDISQESSWHLYDVFTHTQVALNHTIGYTLEEKLAIILHDIGKAESKSFDEKGQAHFYTHALISEQYAQDILKTLAYSKKQVKRICTLIHYHDYYVRANRRVLRRFLSHIDTNFQIAYSILRVQYADDCAKNMKKTQEKLQIIEESIALLKQMEIEKDMIKMRDLAINGNDLVALGYKGKDIGLKMKKLYKIVLDNPTKNTRETLLSLAKR